MQVSQGYFNVLLQDLPSVRRFDAQCLQVLVDHSARRGRRFHKTHKSRSSAERFNANTAAARKTVQKSAALDACLKQIEECLFQPI